MRLKKQIVHWGYDFESCPNVLISLAEERQPEKLLSLKVSLKLFGRQPVFTTFVLMPVG